MKSFRSVVVFLVASILIGSILQVIYGNMDISLFAFPVNVGLLVALIGVTVVLYREKKDSSWLKAWASAPVSVALMAMTFIGCMVIAFNPRVHFQHSWPFNIVLMYLLGHLFMVILYYKGAYRLRFYLNHVGLFVVIAGLSLGAADTHRWKASAYPGDSIGKAVDDEGRIHPLGYTVKLEDFAMKTYANGVPEMFRAVVSTAGQQHEIKVNHPWNRSWKEDVYLVSYGGEAGHQYCILEFVVQPWKYVVMAGVVLTACGAVLLLWGRKKNKGVKDSRS